MNNVVKIKNPLRKRWYREIRKDKGKYLALFLFLCITIGFVSGFLVADNSLKKSYDESFEKYNLEDGHFSLAVPANKDLIKKLEKKNVNVKKQFYKDEPLQKTDHSIRVFQDRKSINKECMMKGKMPKNKNEIVIDRLYAENNKIEVGDNIKISKKNFKISGFVALPDYSCLFKNNTDMMFDANKFTIAVVTKEGFDRISDKNKVYQYVWKEKGQVNYSSFEKILKNTGLLTDYLRQRDNNAINFTGDDMGQDKAMITTLLYIIIVVIGFVFGITVRGVVEGEATQIGTLRASGYTKWELILHYIKLPVMITIMGAIAGNILGYTYMKKISADLYFQSYSLTTYKTLWTPEAFILTTVIPAVIIFFVSFGMLYKMLSMEPLRFIRRDLKRKNKTKAVNLPDWSFMNRFRIRVIGFNKGAYIVLTIGLFFAGILLMFGLVMNPMIKHFKEDVKDSMFSKYQYVLKASVPTKTKDAEKYSVKSLQVKGSDDAMVYGIRPSSKYVKGIRTDVEKDEVLISNGYAEKYGLKTGDKITLKKKNSDEKYTFKIVGIKDYAAKLAVFIPQKNFNKKFHEKKDYYNGYFSDKKIKDIDDIYIATVITYSDLTVIADQLESSMAGIFPVLTAFALVMYVLLMYILSKFIMDKNKGAISLLRILGYTGKEAGKIYNNATAIVVIIALILSLPVARIVMRSLYFVFMQKINGWMVYYVDPMINIEIIVGGAVCYTLVHLLQKRNIGKINMSDALKSVE